MLLSTLSFAKIFHGAGMQMKHSGTGIYYKPGLQLTQNSQIISDIGLHFDTPARAYGYYDSSYKYRSMVVELLTGYRKELFEKFLEVGQGHPGSVFSLIEIVTTLFHKSFIRFDKSKNLFHKSS